MLKRLCLLVLAACVPPADAEKVAPPAVAVETGVVRTREVPRYLEVTGQLRSADDAEPATRLELALPQASAAAVSPGARIAFSVASDPYRTWRATVSFVAARSSARDLAAEAVLDEPDVALQPGMIATVRLPAGEHTVPVVDRSAIADREGTSTLFVVVNGRVEQRIVQLGDRYGELVVATRGVAEGERVVLAPTEKVKNGVRVVN